MIAHLHHLSSGKSLVRMLTCDLLNLPPPPVSVSVSSHALVRFFDPVDGQLHWNAAAIRSCLVHRNDLFHSIFEEGTHVSAGEYTNDDRPGLVLLVGNDVEELKSRSKFLVHDSNALVVVSNEK